MLRRALMYACELREAKPRTMGSPQPSPADSTLPTPLRPHPYAADTTSRVAGLDMGVTAASRMFGETTAGRTSGETSAVAKAVNAAAAKSRRNLTMQVFLHCARIDVSPLACTA